MSVEQAKEFLRKMQNDPELKAEAMACATADDVARIGTRLGLDFSGDELLLLNGQKVETVTVHKRDLPGEYH